MTVELLQKDAAFREEYIKSALKEQDLALLGVKLRNIVDALGGIGKLSKASGLNRTSLYKSLSGNFAPGLDTVEKIFDFAGFSLSVERKKSTKKREMAPA
jgi:probable addiction module antidote protein